MRLSCGGAGFPALPATLFRFFVEARFELELQLEPETAKPFQESNLRVTSFRFVNGTSAIHGP